MYTCICIYVCVYIYTYIYIYIISGLHSLEGQSNFPFRLQHERFIFKSNTHRRLFAWRHLEAWQYVAQSGLHLHQSEPHSCKGNKKNCRQELRNAGGFIISLFLQYIACNKMHYGFHYTYNNICRRRETNLPFRDFYSPDKYFPKL